MCLYYKLLSCILINPIIVDVLKDILSWTVMTLILLFPYILIIPIYFSFEWYSFCSYFYISSVLSYNFYYVLFIYCITLQHLQRRISCITYNGAVLNLLNLRKFQFVVTCHKFMSIIYPYFAVLRYLAFFLLKMPTIPKEMTFWHPSLSLNF